MLKTLHESYLVTEIFLLFLGRDADEFHCANFSTSVAFTLEDLSKSSFPDLFLDVVEFTWVFLFEVNHLFL